MLLTPRIIRTHEYTARDLSPIYVGTNQNFGLTGPPPLIAAPPVEPDTAPGTWSRAAGARQCRRKGLPVPTAPPGGTPGQAHAATTQSSGCAARRTAGAARSDGAADDHAGAAGADFGDRAGRRCPCRRRPVHGADLRQQRVARVDRHADGDLQPRRASYENSAGGQLPAAGRRERRLHAEYRRRHGPRRPGIRAHGRQRGRVRIWPAGRASVRCRRRRAPRSSPISGVLANPTGGAIPVQFVPASVVVR